jgi:hypothetical protein
VKALSSSPSTAKNKQTNHGGYIQWNTIQPLKKKEMLPFGTTWMSLEYIMLSEISQPQKHKCGVIPLICEIKKEKQLSI